MSSSSGAGAGASSGHVGPTSQQIAAMGPPYPPQTQSLGTPPTPLPDVPVSAIFLALYLITGVIHMRLFIGNKIKEHKFVFSGAMFAYCTMRVITMSLRIAWSYQPRNVKLGITAEVFVAVGTVVLFVINLFFTQRLMRARHPHIGWHAPFRILVPPVTVVLTIICILMVIGVVVDSFYTLDTHTLHIDRNIQWAVLCWFTFVAFLPIPIVAFMLAIPRRTYIDKFGAGRFRTKIIILLSSSTLLTLGAGFRCGTSFLNPTPLHAPMPWYYSTACFYIFDFTTEFIVVLMYLVVRVDRRFFVPDHCHGAGEFSGDVVSEKPTAGAVAGSEVYMLHPDGRTLSLADGRTFSMPERASLSLNHPDLEDRGAGHSFDETASVDSSQYLSVNRKSGRYEMTRMSQSTLATLSSPEVEGEKWYGR